MTENQATQLIAQIQSETTAIDAQIQRTRHNSYSVRLTLKRKQLIFIAYSLEDWQGIKEAWSCYEPELVVPDEPVKPVRVKTQRHLVDGVPMRIRQCSDGFWKAFYRDGEKTKSKYFGKDDPRGNYPVYQEEERAS